MSDEISEVVENNEPVESTEQVEPARKYKVKIDDTEEEIEESELLKGYQKAKSSDRRFQEAAQLRKEASESEEQMRDLFQQLRDNPDLLEELGIDVDDYAQKRMLRNLERSLKSPEELELEELRAFKNKQGQAEKVREESEQKIVLDRQYDEAVNSIDTEIFETLQDSGMKPTPRLIARIAEQLLATLDDEGNRGNATEAFGRVKNDIQADVKELLENLEPEQLAEMFPSLVKKLRAASISSAEKNIPAFKAGVSPKSSNAGTGNQRRSIDAMLG